jgi:chain length determinant protein EpsF
MNLNQALLVLRAHIKLALLALIATVAVAAIVSKLMPKQYTATATVVLDVKSPDPIAGMMLPALVMPGYMATQVDIINSERVALRVVKMLKLDQNATVKEQWLEATDGKGELDRWLSELMQQRLKVTPSRESSVISINYSASDPDFAAAIANAFARAFIETNIELRVDPAKQYSAWFSQQQKLLRDNLERAQARLSAFQRKYGIVVASDERVDTETAKLNDLSAQLTIVQGLTTDSLSKQRSGRAAETLPEVVQNPLISSLKSEIARQEARLHDMAGNLGENHPQYQRMKAELASLKRQLDLETRHITSGFAASRAVGKDREAELRAAIAAQKKRLLELKSQRDEVAVLMRDVEAAQRAYEAVSQRLNQASLESQSTQTNVSVLTPASAPLAHSSPKARLNILIAIVLGSALGIGAAFMVEMFDRRIRSAEDLAEMLHLPVLGMIPPAKGRTRLALGFRKPALAIK